MVLQATEGIKQVERGNGVLPSCPKWRSQTIPLPRETASTLPTIVVRGEAGLAAKELSEIAEVRVTNVKRNGDDALPGFAEQSFRQPIA